MSQQPSIWFPGVNLDLPIAQGLLAAWPSWEGGGSQLGDFSDQANHCTLTGGPAWTPWQQGACLSFNGSSTYLPLARNIVIPSGQGFTFSVLLNPAHTGSSIISLYGHNNAAGDYSRLLRFGSSWYWYDEGNVGGVFAESVFAANEWQHYTFVYRPTKTNKRTVYRNGVQVATSATGFSNPTEISMLAAYQASTGEWNGYLANMALWGRPLTLGEVSLLWERPWLLYEPPDDLPLWVGATSVAGGVIAPTAVLDGPLVGPLGGPM